MTIERIVLELSLEVYRASGHRVQTRGISSEQIYRPRAHRHVVTDRVMAGQVLVDLEANDVRADVARARAELDHATECHGETLVAVEAARGLSTRHLRDGFPDWRATRLSAEPSSIEGQQ